MAIDKDYVKSMKIWFKTTDLAIKKSKDIIAQEKENIKHSNSVIKVESIYLKQIEIRQRNAKKQFEDYLKNNK